MYFIVKEKQMNTDGNKYFIFMLATAVVLAFSFYSSILFILKNENLLYKAVGAIVFFATLWLGAQRDTFCPFYLIQHSLLP